MIQRLVIDAGLIVATLEPDSGNVELPSIGAAFAAPQTDLDLLGV
jgi:hypothetical protein